MNGIGYVVRIKDSGTIERCVHCANDDFIAQFYFHGFARLIHTHLIHAIHCTAFICMSVAADVIISNDYHSQIANQLNENICKALLQLQCWSLCGKVFCILWLMCTAAYSGLFFLSFAVYLHCSTFVFSSDLKRLHTVFEMARLLF